MGYEQKLRSKVDPDLVLVMLIMEQGQAPSIANEAKWAFENLEVSDFRDRAVSAWFAIARTLYLQGSQWTPDLVHALRGGEKGFQKAAEEYARFFDSLPEHLPLPSHGIRALVEAKWQREDSVKAALALEEASKSHDPHSHLEELRLLERRQPFKPRRGLAEDMLSALEESADLTSGFRFKIHPLDHFFGRGVQGGEFVVVGARPGVGKTALMVQSSYNNMIDGKSIAYCSLEMKRGHIMQRMCSIRCNGNAFKLDTLDQEQQTMVANFAKIVQDADRHENIFFQEASDNQKKSVANLGLWVRRRKLPDVIFVDYIQLLSSPDHTRAGRTQEVGAISRDLKLLAMELNVPIIASCQLNRLAEQRTDRRPRLSDLRESGSIEQDADTVVLLHSPYRVWEDDQKGSPPSKDLLEAVIAKNRRGETGTVQLRYTKESQRIDPWSFTV